MSNRLRSFFIFLVLVLSISLLYFIFDNVMGTNKTKIQIKTLELKLSVCEGKSIKTVEGLMLEPTNKKGLYAVGYLDKDNKIQPQ